MPAALGQPEDNGCNVEIIGDWTDSGMYPGQEVRLHANTNNTVTAKANYTWTVEGPIIKDYDDSVQKSDYLRSVNNVANYSPMSPSDFENENIKFYWQKDMTGPIRSVTGRVTTPNGQECTDSQDYAVQKSINISYQPEGFYTEYNHQDPFSTPNNTVLREHNNWHAKVSVCCSETYNGTLFLDFHNLFLAHFNAYRNLFGYENVTSWNPN